MFPVLHQPVDFYIRDEYTLQTHRGGGIGCLAEHVPATEQPFRTRLVQDHAAVRVGCHGEGDAGWEVGLD